MANREHHNITEQVTPISAEKKSWWNRLLEYIPGLKKEKLASGTPQEQATIGKEALSKLFSLADEADSRTAATLAEAVDEAVRREPRVDRKKLSEQVAVLQAKETEAAQTFKKEEQKAADDFSDFEAAAQKLEDVPRHGTQEFATNRVQINKDPYRKWKGPEFTNPLNYLKNEIQRLEQSNDQLEKMKQNFSKANKGKGQLRSAAEEIETQNYQKAQDNINEAAEKVWQLIGEYKAGQTDGVRAFINERVEKIRAQEETYDNPDDTYHLGALENLIKEVDNKNFPTTREDNPEKVDRNDPEIFFATEEKRLATDLRAAEKKQRAAARAFELRSTKHAQAEKKHIYQRIAEKKRDLERELKPEEIEQITLEAKTEYVHSQLKDTDPWRDDNKYIPEISLEAQEFVQKARANQKSKDRVKNIVKQIEELKKAQESLEGGNSEPIFDYLKKYNHQLWETVNIPELTKNIQDLFSPIADARLKKEQAAEETQLKNSDHTGDHQDEATHDQDFAPEPTRIIPMRNVYEKVKSGEVILPIAPLAEISPKEDGNVTSGPKSDIARARERRDENKETLQQKKSDLFVAWKKISLQLADIDNKFDAAIYDPNTNAGLLVDKKYALAEEEKVIGQYLKIAQEEDLQKFNRYAHELSNVTAAAMLKKIDRAIADPALSDTNEESAKKQITTLIDEQHDLLIWQRLAEIGKNKKTTGKLKRAA